MEAPLLLGRSADWWNTAMIASLVIAPILVAVVTTGSVFATKREAVAAQAELGRYKAQVSTQVEGAKVEAAKANERASEANERAAELDKTAAQLQLDLEKERNKTAMRLWTKDQFDALQDIKDVVKEVGILWESHCIECQLFAEQITKAFVAAGVQLYGAHETEEIGSSDTGIFVSLPVGSDLEKHPLVVALKKARLNPFTTFHVETFSKIRTDIPVIFVGERFPNDIDSPVHSTGIKRVDHFAHREALIAP